ncbi:hypothetical protein ASPZODRAFT_133807 [Penicilliopsis zonata CBS 506.65]|uniref:Major facilitator superfamily (MFS) profile domain-containing protein n=1 Tax=Penicilliopsis zonata CBS 506.65 TaxID=1073090 RepID=A0A1L9SFE7_9EURO|nr:hypothetical protein ASPZODRAFT_133807 [Penicilliopsis zonata CBS 506.65]OJJ45940.1 hypothetical protein ASPZODRAFT_133807 [Penicilliopsis zonata CBS 506.65]
MFLVALDSTIISTAIPQITADFHSLTDVGWYGSAFFLTMALFQHVWGTLYRHCPLKATFITTIAALELGSLVCAVAHSSTSLIVGRAITGMGGSGVMAGVYIIMGLSVAPARRPAYMGVLGATFSIASFAGPLIGGAFTSETTWRWCFWVNLPIGGVAVVIILLLFHPPAHARPDKVGVGELLLLLDPVGFVLLLGALLCYLLAVQWGGVTKAWSDAAVIGTLVGFGVLTLLFIAKEMAWRRRPMFPGRLFRGNRLVGVSCAFVFVFPGCFFAILYFLPIYFQAIAGVSAAESGIRTLPLVLGVGILSMLTGLILPLIGSRPLPLMLGAGILTTIACGLLYTMDRGSPPAQWIGYQALAGIGVGMAIQMPVVVSQASVPLADISTITAITLFFQFLAGAIWVQGAQAVFDNFLVHALARHAPGVSPQTVINAGATGLSQTLDAATLSHVLDAYMDGLKAQFLLDTVLAGVATVIALGLGWRKLGLAPGMAVA